MSTRDLPRSTRLRRRAATAFLAVGTAALVAPATAWAPPAVPGPNSTTTTTVAAVDAAEALDAQVATLLSAKQQAEAERVAAWAAAVERAEAEEAARVAAWQEAVARHEAEQAEAERVAAWAAAVERNAAEEAERRRATSEAARAAERAAAPQAPSGAAAGGGWAALRSCESGGNYGAVNPSGTYRGAYQFSRTTWNSVASKRYPHLVGVDPAAAAAGDQDAMAQALYDMAGPGQWPHCGRHLR